MIKEKMRIFRVENIFLSSIEENWVAHEDITHQVSKSNVLERLGGTQGYYTPSAQSYNMDITHHVSNRTIWILHTIW
jgi:hypothetical protein